MRTLKGITWNHTRGYAPLAVTAKIWNDFHPEVSIEWHIRSLWSFGEGSLEELAREYDLLLIDHPFIGTVAKRRFLVDFATLIPQTELTALQDQSVGQSFASYEQAGQVYALPVDAASQVSVARADLLAQHDQPLPQSWEQVIQLARATRKVAIPLAPMGAIGSFFTLYANQFSSPFVAEEWHLEDEKIHWVLNQLQTLYQLVDAECLQSYPTALLNRMAQTNQIWYIPITYGYVNYSMRGYAPNQLTFHSLPSTSPHGGTLGGVGLAISAYSQLRDQAVQYATWVAGAECQQTVYALSGGQPANRQAWTSATLNNLTNQFYQNTLTSTERAFVRPRFDGFHHFQSQAGRVLQAFLQNQHSVKNLIEDWKKLFQQAKT